MKEVIKYYKNSRGHKVKLTDENYERLPDSYKATLTIWEEPIVPEFLTNKVIENESSESEDTKNTGNGPGTGKRGRGGGVS